MGSVVRQWRLLVGVLIIPVFFASTAASARFTSTSYIIDASVNNSFGGQGSSTNYKTVTSGGESIIGNGAGGSYKMGAGYVAQLDRGMQLTVQPAGLLAYYPLEETVMPAVYDNSASSVNGVATGAPTSTTGKIGSALSFDGSSQYVQLGSTSSLQGTTITAEAWIKSSSGASTMAVVTKASGFWLGVNFGKAAIYDWNTSTTCTAPSPSVTDGAWHHVAATLSSGVANGSIIYVDGIQQQTCTWTPTSQNGQPGLGASKAASWQQYFNGQIDTVKVYNRILSASEVKAEYDAQAAGNPAGVHLGAIVPGASNTTLLDAIAQTDAAGYNLSVSQNQNLTSGGNTIPAVGGSIASPASWSEGVTNGLGFTLYGTNASSVPAKWNSGNSYAAFPGASTSFYTRTGYTGGTKDYLNMRIRLDVPSTQAAASYQNTLTLTGTILP